MTSSDTFLNSQSRGHDIWFAFEFTYTWSSNVQKLL